MKTQVDKADNATNIEIFGIQNVQVQEINVTDQETTLWQRIYKEYKSSTESLKEKYNPLLKQEILSKQGKDPHSLASIFKDIAEDNIGLAQKADTAPSLKLYHYNDAAIACQYTLKLTNDPSLQRDNYKILDKIQMDMVKLCGGDVSKIVPINSKQDIEALCHRKELQSIRDYTSQSVEKIEQYRELKNDELYINETAHVFKDIASGMQQYLHNLYKSAEEILGDPPCDYTVIGLGSMALQQMTPYSDLECGILTANEDYKQHTNPAIQDYFRNLSHLVHFKIINLGETIIPTSAYNINLSEFVSPAVNFDLGGKTPLGRIEKDKPYELIQTVDGMLSYLQNPFETSDHVDKNLASILQKVCFIHGNKELVTTYQEQAQDFLLAKSDNGRPNYEERAVKALLEGVEEIDYTKPSPQPKKIEGNLEQFSFNPNKAQGKLFDVKQEIYRMPDRFIYNLGLICGVQEDSSWQTIDELRERGIINPQGAANLKKALSFATNLRLKVYSNYGYQKDTMDFAKAYEVQSNEVQTELNKELTTVFKLTREDLQEDGALFQYYYTALALRNSLEEFCKLDPSDPRKRECFKNNAFYRDDSTTRGDIFFRLMRYQEAFNYKLIELKELEKLEEKQIQIKEHMLNSDIIAYKANHLGIIKRELADFSNAQLYFEKAFKSLELCLKYARALNSFDLLNHYNKYSAVILNNLGDIYLKQAHPLEAITILEKALFLTKECFGEKHLEVSKVLNNLGVAKWEKGERKEGISCIEKALEISHDTIILSNIGHKYGQLGDTKKSLKYLKEVEDKFISCYGYWHPNVGTVKNNIAEVLYRAGSYKLAMNYLKDGLKILQVCLNSRYSNILECKKSIADTYKNLGMYNEALAELAGILTIYKKTNQQDKIVQYQREIAAIKKAKNLYEEANQLIEDNTIVQAKSYDETSKRISILKTALDQFKECNNFQQSNVMSEKILQTLDLLIKAQTSLYQNSKKKTVEMRRELNDYQKEYEELKKSMDDKKLKLQEIEEYLAAQKQIRDEQSENISLADETLSTIETETNSSFEEAPEHIELVVSLMGENNNEYATVDLN